MKDIPDICIREKTDEVVSKAEELGWRNPESYETTFLEADNWGELKKKIKRNRESCDVLVFRGGDEKLNRKAASDSRIDVLLHPEKGRKDSGVDQVVAEKAAENDVAIGFDLQQVLKPAKTQTHILSHWRRNLKLCEKYDVRYLLTTGAGDKFRLRAPRDLKSMIDSLGYNGRKALETHKMILKENTEIRESEVDTGGVEKR
jgi:ribonuclease P/MRP protein subunit RPP1